MRLPPARPAPRRRSRPRAHRHRPRRRRGGGLLGPEVGGTAFVEHLQAAGDPGQRVRDVGLEAARARWRRTRRRRVARRPPRLPPRRRSGGSSSSAASVSPRSPMRYAACSWARTTIRSASSWAFSMIRLPSWLIRLAARTSSGTATRSSSMRLSAASRSMIAFLVIGRFLPFAISDSRRSTRKMMSSGRPPLGSTPRRGVALIMARPAGRPTARTTAGTTARSTRCAGRAGPPARRPRGAGSISDTSPPNRAISLTRLELM